MVTLKHNWTTKGTHFYPSFQGGLKTSRHNFPAVAFSESRCSLSLWCECGACPGKGHLGPGVQPGNRAHRPSVPFVPMVRQSPYLAVPGTSAPSGDFP